MKIGLVGAPGSGKTTLAAKLYARLLEEGISTARLVSEYGSEHLGMGRKISKYIDQKEIMMKQIEREEHHERCNFDPIICDTCIWMSGIYLQDMIDNNRLTSPIYTEQKAEYLRTSFSYAERYDITIFVPMHDDVDKLSRIRIHNSSEARAIENKIKNYLAHVKTKAIEAPKELFGRDAFINKLVEDIKDCKR